MNRGVAADWQFVNALIFILNRLCIAPAGTRDPVPRVNADTGQPALPDFASTRARARFRLRAGARKPAPRPETAAGHDLEPRFSGGGVKTGMRPGGGTLRPGKAAGQRRVQPGPAVEQE